MHKIRGLWRCWYYQKRLNNGLKLMSRKKYSWTSQINGNKHDPVKTVFTPTKWEIQRTEKLFDSIGGKTVLDESGVKLKKFTKLQQLPEIALLGRTSVGKSSLINALLHQKKLAKTSKTPGHTRLINYFNVGSKFYLVDLPGYGYVEGQGQGSQNFVNIVEKYLQARTGKELRSVCLLIDGKVGIKNNDLIAVEMLEEMDASFHVVVTKIDRVNKGAQDLITRQINQEIQKHSTLCFPHIFPVSSKDKIGLSELRCFVALCTGIF